jgi:tRNA threonylcarbamoyladenosine biosynthesis protein TsaE
MLSFSKTYPLTSEKDTKLLAESLAKTAEKGDVIFLKGGVGAGKSTFSRFFIQFFLGTEEEVPSPTFTIVQTYLTKDFTIWHFDLYRLNHSEEVFELGIEDAFYGGVSLVEWPEKLSIQPSKYLLASFENIEKNRSVKMDYFGDWGKRSNAI